MSQGLCLGCTRSTFLICLLTKTEPSNLDFSAQPSNSSSISMDPSAALDRPLTDSLIAACFRLFCWEQSHAS